MKFDKERSRLFAQDILDCEWAYLLVQAKFNKNNSFDEAVFYYQVMEDMGLVEIRTPEFQDLHDNAKEFRVRLTAHGHAAYDGLNAQWVLKDNDSEVK